MGYPTDNPMDGRGARPDDNDGGIYAEGSRVCMRPERTASGVTLGGTLADCATAATAKEIARRCAEFRPLMDALRGLAQWCESRALYSEELHAAIAAVARAEDR